MSLTRLVPIPSGINIGVTAARQATMLSLLGNPRGSYDQTCQAVTNATLTSLITSADVGPFPVRGLAPAVESLMRVMRDIRAEAPEIHAALGTVGMLCARFVRGSTTSISNHSWGTAIDLTLEGRLDTRGDGLVQEGLTRIYPIFNHHGWYWGAGFRTEDAMHFECGDDLIRTWALEGIIGSAAPVSIPVILSMGDRGPDVMRLQQALIAKGASISADGIFGRATQAAVMAFQAAHGLAVDGVAGPRTLSALGIG
ncbi:MAG: peptidoglycan-binding protein [Acetobacteraceae bacterium]